MALFILFNLRSAFICMFLAFDDCGLASGIVMIGVGVYLDSCGDGVWSESVAVSFFIFFCGGFA